MNIGGGEVWVNRRPLRVKHLLANGRRGTATVVFALDGGTSDTPAWSELWAEVEITLDDGTPGYTVRGILNGDASPWPWRDTAAPWVRPGTRLPIAVHADDDAKLAIDWAAWKDAGGPETSAARGDQSGAIAENVAAYRSGRAGG